MLVREKDSVNSMPSPPAPHIILNESYWELERSLAKQLMPKPLTCDLLVCHFVACIWSSFLTEGGFNLGAWAQAIHVRGAPRLYRGKMCSHPSQCFMADSHPILNCVSSLVWNRMQGRENPSHESTGRFSPCALVMKPFHHAPLLPAQGD